jgi:hypothetical protein
MAEHRRRLGEQGQVGEPDEVAWPGPEPVGDHQAFELTPALVHPTQGAGDEAADRQPVRVRDLLIEKHVDKRLDLGQPSLFQPQQPERWPLGR